MSFLRPDMGGEAVATARSVPELPAYWGLLTLGLDQATLAVMVISGDLTVHHANSAARLVFARSKVLKLKGDRLHLNRKAERTRLLDAVAAAVACAYEGAPPHAEFVVLHNRQQSPVMALHVMSLVGPGLPPLVSLRVADMLTPSSVDPNWFVHLLNLTQAESRVAAGLLDGLDLREIAERQAVALETVRNHLKRAMGKVGARTQAQLVRMLASSYGVIDPEAAVPSAVRRRAAARG